MLWLKAFHVIAVVAWFAGLFYLPRLYRLSRGRPDSISIERFVIMERRLFVIMTIGASHRVLRRRDADRRRPLISAMGWLRVKLLLVLLLIAYHAYCCELLRDFAAHRNKRSANWYRAFNEVPSLLLIAIVVLAVVKPF